MFNLAGLEPAEMELQGLPGLVEVVNTNSYGLAVKI